MTKILRAKHVVPIASPAIEDGYVAIEGGRVVECGRFDAAAFATRSVEDLGEVVLLPGLINAHAHLELSHARQGERPSSFGEWLLRIVMRRVSLAPADLAAAVAAATMDGAAECLRFGITTVGDITREVSLTRRALRDSPLNVVSYGEVQAMAQRRALLDDRLAVAIDPTFATDQLAIGLSPHAPYTVEPPGFHRCVKLARERRLPICTHLSETLEERRFLADQSGPLRDLWDQLGAWDDAVPRWTGSPLELAKSVGLLDIAPLLAHVNYASDDDLDLLAAGDASVVWCPRTHAYFGHAPHRWREMLARGINICVGTDSRASSPDLNVVDDLRLVHQQSPEVPVSALWEMVTTRAARALHRTDVGAIARGMRANLVGFAAHGPEPLREILESSAIPGVVIVAGQRL